MKLIKCVGCSALKINQWTFTDKGIPADIGMLANASVRQLLDRKVLDMVDGVVEAPEAPAEPKTAIANQAAVVVPAPIKTGTVQVFDQGQTPVVAQAGNQGVPWQDKQPMCVSAPVIPPKEEAKPQPDMNVHISKPKVDEVATIPVIAAPEVQQQPVIQADIEMPQIIVQDPNNPALKTFAPMDEAMDADLATLDRELKEIAAKQEIIVPEKKN